MKTHDYSYFFINIVCYGKNIVKGATQVSECSLKQYFYMFKRSQGKHNS
jgi:hypothetical protein